MKKLMKGNEAVAEAAIRCGCKMYFGYPITPQNEIPEYMAAHLPEAGGVFLQSESELAAANMLLGAGATGTRAMTSSSGPGISLMQEAISYIIAERVPAVIVNMDRGGPGLGNLSATQGDYFQSTRGGGHGDYFVYTLAPYSVQEAGDLVQRAFDVADKYRTPVMVLGDAIIGQMMEPADIKTVEPKAYDKSWALHGWDDKSRPRAVVTSRLHEPKDLKKMIDLLRENYERMRNEDIIFEEQRIEGAEHIIVAFGTSARIVESALDILEGRGIKAGLLRPITLFPFPDERLRELAEKRTTKSFLVVEMNEGQMVNDVRLAVREKKPVNALSKYGTFLPEPKEIADLLQKYIEEAE